MTDYGRGGRRAVVAHAPHPRRTRRRLGAVLAAPLCGVLGDDPYVPTHATAEVTCARCLRLLAREGA